MSKAIAIIGRTKTGKTTLTKELLNGFEPSRVHVYDVNNEYAEYKRGALPKFSEFLNKLTIKDRRGELTTRKSAIVFEEATIFLRHNTQSEQITELLTTKRHTENFIILNFHSLRKLPVYILDMLDFVVIKKTNDNPNFIKTKFGDFEDLYDAYCEANEFEDYQQNDVEKDNYKTVWCDLYN